MAKPRLTLPTTAGLSLLALAGTLLGGCVVRTQPERTRTVVVHDDRPPPARTVIVHDRRPPPAQTVIIQDRRPPPRRY
jgi:hypothetical protein